MHRIVDATATGFVIQGDNNDWLDEDQPTQDEILGKLFLRVPQGGKALAALRSPASSSARRGPRRLGRSAAAVAPAAAARRPRREARRPRPARRPSRCRSAPGPGRSRSASALVALVSVVGGGVLLAMPSTQTAVRTVQVTQQGQFSYTGKAAARHDLPDGRHRHRRHRLDQAREQA